MRIGPAKPLKKVFSHHVAVLDSQKGRQLAPPLPDVLLPGIVRLRNDDRSVKRTGGVAGDLVKQARRDHSPSRICEPARSTSNSQNFYDGNEIGRTRRSCLSETVSEDTVSIGGNEFKRPDARAGHEVYHGIVSQGEFAKLRGVSRAGPP